jgi:hypothetical protein
MNGSKFEPEIGGVVVHTGHVTVPPSQSVHVFPTSVRNQVSITILDSRRQWLKQKAFYRLQYARASIE